MRKRHITVIGGVNMDISANLTAPFVHADSIPGHVDMGCGGVARNIAHNLCLLGHKVMFTSLFGDDAFGTMCHRQCEQIGMDLALSECRQGARNGLYLCVNDLTGDMVVAVADTGIIDNLDPFFLEARLEHINAGDAVVADTNLPTASLQFLLEHCRAPIFVDTVSTAKAAKVVEAMRQATAPRLHTLKLNSMEAFAITPCGTVGEAAAWLHKLGVEHVFITLGAGGVLASSRDVREELPAPHVTVVNTTGAGDAFLAGVVHAFAGGASFLQAARTGLAAAHATLQSPRAVNEEIAQALSGFSF